ncbi:MAG TPA: c-type cytochrome [Burkholderiales bacterium]|nr:c-type cytochrome [Burkholderiales bacterium]
MLLALVVIAAMGMRVSGWAARLSENLFAQGIPGKVPACATCHGLRGEGGGEGVFPRIAGQPAAYLETQLKAFRDGGRSNPLMSPAVAGLSDADIGAVAAFLELEQPPFAASPTPDESRLARGQRLVALGRWDMGVPACTSCHGAALQGVAPAIPALSGQSSRYLSAQLRAYKNGARAPGPLALMGRIARGMSGEDIEDAALYIGSLQAGASPQIPRPAAPESYVAKPQSPDGFVPPPEAAIPEGPYGELVRLGQSIFEDTPKYAASYAGNTLSCRNCHLDRGRDPKSSPMWAAYVHYPEYRKKDGLVNTIQMRIQGCFRYSQNGTVPEADSREITALVTYFYWMAAGLPVGVKPRAAGYPKLDPPKEVPSPERGARVYASNCALCHGEGGLGRSSGGQQVFPPLWGPHSFNWGAGMHQVDRAAGFIKTSMPFGAGGTLTDQEAWDVAAYVNSRPRPQDPRFTESVEKTRELYHADHEYDYYGREVDGLVLGAPGALEERDKHSR